MAKRVYRRSNHDGMKKDDVRDGGAREEPQDDLVEEPADQREGDDPEDLLRLTDAEQAARDRELRRGA
jgi:hypothetical protein